MNRVRGWICLALASTAMTPAWSAGIAGDALSEIDIVWLLVCAILVFFMQTGFALIESGLSRAKNAVNVLMKNFLDVCFGSLAFAAIGFGLMFGSNPSGWLGTDRFMLNGISGPTYVLVFFQMMFAATAATIVSGAVAERTRFPAYILGSMLIVGIIYPVFGSWAWGSMFSGTGWLAELGFIDFAGSTVVHSIGAWCALAAVIVVRPRLGRFGLHGQSRPILGHNLTSVAMGGFILWMGWFGFNAGSALGVDGGLGRIVLNTNLAAAAGAIGALVAPSLVGRRTLMTFTVNGAIAGLVAITAAAHVVTPAYAVVIGFIGGIVSVFGAVLLEKWRIDDVVSAIPVHGMAGVWGTLSVGLFRDGYGFSAQQLGVQALGCAVAFVWAFGSAWVVYTLIERSIGMRASSLDEQRGLDFTEHYEIGYPEFQAEVIHRGKTQS